MKKVFSILLVLCLLLPVMVFAEGVDAYTSASNTKTILSGEALDAAVKVLEEQSSLLSTVDEAKAEGYVAKSTATTAQIMSINPDGSVGLSTISEWKVEGAKAYAKLTQGQNAMNLAEIGSTGSLLVKSNAGGYYIVHLKTEQCVILHYSEENAGNFDQYYSGAANALDEYDLTFEVTAIEQSFALMF